MYNKFPIHYGLFFAPLKMRRLKGFFRTEVIFEDKKFSIFIFKNNFSPIGFLLARLFFRRKKTVRSESEICYAPNSLKINALKI